MFIGLSVEQYEHIIGYIIHADILFLANNTFFQAFFYQIDIEGFQKSFSKN